MAVALALATAPAGQAATPRPDPLIGATRDAVIAKFGEPRNTMTAGNREVLFFEHEKVTLRDNAVILIEPIAAEPVRRAPPPPPATSAPGTGDSAGTAPAAGSETAATNAAPPSAIPANNSAAATTVVTPVPATPPAPDPNAPLEIRVRTPGSRSASRPETSTPAPAEAPPPAAAAAPTVPAPAPVTTSNAPVTEKAATSAPAQSGAPMASVAAPSSSPAPAAPSTAPASAETSSAKESAADASATAAPPEPPKAELTAEEAIKQKAKAGIRRARRANADALEDDLTEQQQQYLSPRTYIIAAITVGAGVAFLLWRNRQRQLELAASAVSRTPFSAPAAATSGGGAIFGLELVGKLEWKRFEELVASYYSKTGVVAVRTKTGPASPVHIKISWKGEPRPFALVQCLSHPAGLIDAKPLQELVTVLAAEDIRRGYVVTTGKFNVPARDFAEEKHLTLLPGDIFLEKLNALPDAARNELMSEVTNGDYTTPSCPKCEAKMVRNSDDPSQWRCAAHPDQVIPVK